jgi:hypothetical protein
MTRRTFIAGTVCSWALLAGGSALATTMLALPTPRLFQRADLVVVVDVDRVAAVEAGSRVWTKVDAHVAQVFKGASVGQQIQILTPGGEAGKFGQFVEGSATFRPGETCVVFLSRLSNGAYEPVAMEQGKLTIEPATGRNGWVVRRTVSATIVERAPDGTRRPGQKPAETEPMDDYFAQLRKLAGGQP